MRTYPLAELKLPRLSSPPHNSRVFKLLWVLDMHVDSIEKPYRVLFQTVNNPRPYYMLEEIYPEYLSYYTMGSHYLDSKKIQNPAPEGSFYDIGIDSSQNNQILPVSEVLTDAEHPISHSFTIKGDLIDFSPEIGRQYGLVFDNGSVGSIQAKSSALTSPIQVIIPCSVIGSDFYFTSTTMRKRIFDSKLGSLYKTITIDPVSGIHEIDLNPGVDRDDAFHILRFYKNSFAGERWKRVSHSLVKETEKLSARKETKSAPVKIDFPVEQLLNLRVRGKLISNPQTGETKLLVFEIIEEDSALGFEIYRIITHTKDGSSADLYNGSIPKFPRIARNTTGRVRKGIPSSKNAFIVIREEVEEKNVNLAKVTLLTRNVPRTTPPVAQPSYSSGTSGDISLEEARSSGDETLVPGKYKRIDKLPAALAEAPFTLEDFKKMVGRLKHDGAVSAGSYTVHALQDMPRKTTKTRGGMLTLRESYNGRRGNRRQYQYINFDYMKADGSVISVCVVEIDQRRLPNGSSIFILADGKGRAVPGSAVTELLTAYVDAETLDQIGVSMRRHGLTFMHKKHPMDKREDYLNRWCDGLKERLGECE